MKKPQVVDLNESIRQTAQLAQAQFCPTRIQVDLKLSSKSPRVLANPAELTEALLNLLTNAIDAYSSVGSAGTIQITSAVIRDHVLVSVMDDAPATETDARLRLSEPRSIIREIGGDMWISYGETYGTAFIIDLPSASVN
jgi:C4-dicarboxylate-specific signal transduction histidine kinase